MTPQGPGWKRPGGKGRVQTLTALTDRERAHAVASFHLLQPFLQEGVALTDSARQHQCPLLVTRTRLGLCPRVALENPALARAAGISTGRITAITFSCGAALAGLAGALMVPLFSMFADLVLRFLMQGFLAVLVGGLGTVAGPVFGAGVGGVLTAAFPWFLHPVLADVLVFVVAIMLVKLQRAGLLVQ